MARSFGIGSLVREGARLAVRERSLIVRMFFALVGLLASMCVVPGVLGLFMLGRATQQAAGAKERSIGTTLLGGMAMLAVLALPGVAVLLAAAVTPVDEHMGVLGVTALLVLVPLFGAIAGPFLTVAPQLATRDAGLGDALGRAVAGASIAGVGAVLARGLAVGLSVAVPPVVVLLAGRYAPTLASWSVLLCVLFASWIVGFAAACAKHDDALLSSEAAPRAPLRAHVWLPPLIASLVLGGALMHALFTPALAWQEMRTLRRGDWTCSPSLEGFGPHGLTIELVDAAYLGRTSGYGGSVFTSPFDVRTADGGGAGWVFGPAQASAREVCRSEEHIFLVFDAGPGELVVPIDERGVRLDDGFTDRLRSRVGGFELGLIALGLASLFGLGLRLGKRFAQLDALDRAGDALRSLRGTVRVGEGASLTRDGMDGLATGDVTFVSEDGAHAFRLPPRLSILGQHDVAETERLVSGTPVQIIALEALSSSGLRDGAEAWPVSAILLCGRADTARAAISATLARAAAPWVALTSLAFGAASLLLLSA